MATGSNTFLSNFFLLSQSDCTNHHSPVHLTRVMTERGGGVFQQEVDCISGEQQTAGELRLWRLVENHRQPQHLSHLLRLRLTHKSKKVELELLNS